MRAWLIAVQLLAVLASCGGDDGGSGVPCEKHASSCTCGALVDQPQDVTCSASDYGQDGFCCQGAENCQCAEASCANDPIGFCACEASWRHDPSATSTFACDAPAGGLCCREFLREGGGAQCACGPFTSCLAGQEVVASCSTADAAMCGDVGTSVTSCR